MCRNDRKRKRCFMMDKYGALETYFGYTEFRPGQEKLIDGLLGGRDILGIMPTGGGKSLCYQIPALLLPGVTFVVSPLISLMKDQVAALKNAGVSAAYLNSSLTPGQLRHATANVRQRQYKIVYVAPERLMTADFLETAKGVPLSLFAVDEAHCISQWGQDFRPSYLKIAEFLSALPHRPPVAALTATATAPVREDIIRLLELRSPLTELTGFDRPNLFFDVQTPRKKPEALLSLLSRRTDQSGIVYCSTRKTVEAVYELLCAKGVPAAKYHAGLPDEERKENQEDFQFDRKTVMVATNAFGMGIDKSNVSFVLHYNMPKSMEAYYQEAGRAGRDGNPADCILLYSAGDVATARYLIQNSGNEELTPAQQEEVRQKDYHRLEQMVRYCTAKTCLRHKILRYFGQKGPDTCGNCGNCLTDYRERDISEEARKLVQGILAIREKLGYYVGATLIVRTLCGSREKRVLELGLHKLPCHGSMAGTRTELRELLNHLIQTGYLLVDPQYNTLKPQETALGLLRGETVTMRVRVDRPAPTTSSVKKARAKADLSGDPLYEALRRLRTKIAEREGVPAYVVFTNAALADMARRRPATREELLAVSGVGVHKADRYGKQFLAAIKEFADPENAG